MLQNKALADACYEHALTSALLDNERFIMNDLFFPCVTTKFYPNGQVTTCLELREPKASSQDSIFEEEFEFEAAIENEVLRVCRSIEPNHAM